MTDFATALDQILPAEPPQPSTELPPTTAVDAGVAPQIEAEAAAVLPAKNPSPFSAALDQVMQSEEERKQRTQRVRTNILYASGSNPDLAAKAYDLGKRVGLPAETVERNYPRIEAEAKADQWGDPKTLGGALHEWMDDPTNAKLIIDDIAAMQGIELSAKKAGGFASNQKLEKDQYFVGGFLRGFENMGQGFNSVAQANNLNKLATFDRIDRGDAVPATEDPEGYADMSAQQRAETRTRVQGDIFKNTILIKRSREYSAGLPQSDKVQPLMGALDDIAFDKDFLEKTGRALDKFLEAPGEIMLQLSADSAAFMLPTIAGWLLGPTGTFLGSSLPDYASRFNDILKDKITDIVSSDDQFMTTGLDPNDPVEQLRFMRQHPELMKQAQDAAWRGAVVTGTADMLTMGLARPVRSGATIRKNAAAVSTNLAREVTMEGAQEAAARFVAGQDWQTSGVVSEMLGAGPMTVASTAKSSVKEYIDDRRNNAAEVAFREFGDTVIATTELVTELQVHVAEQGALSLDDLITKVQASKLNERSPDKMREFLDTVLGGEEEKTVFVPASVVATYMQDMTSLQAQELVGRLGIADQIERARVSGEDIAIPLAKYVMNVGEAHAAWRADIRKDIDGFSINQAKDFEKTRVAETQAIIDRFEEGLAAGVQLEPRQVVQDKVFTQLKEMGLPTQQAAANAALLAGHANAMAALEPTKYVDALDFYEKHPIRFESDNKRRVRELAPDRLDILLDSIRSGKDPLSPPVPDSHVKARAEAAALELASVLGPGPEKTSAQIAREERKAAQDLFKADRENLAGMLAEMGLDPKTMSNDELRSAMEKAAGGQGQTYDQGEVETEDQADISDDIAPIDSQSEIPTNIEDAASYDNVLAMSKGSVWQKGRDLKMAMQNAVRSLAQAAGVDVSVPSPQTTNYLVRVGVRDALYALQQNANAIGWYDVKTRQALAVMSLVHPEIATDPDARLAFVWALAVTSNGQKVNKNFELAEAAYVYFKRHGEMPTNLKAGQAQKSINKGLKLYNSLREQWGKENARRFMLTHFSVQEITALQKDLKPGGEHADTVVRGAAILGPKIGNGFFSNLFGHFDALTMDRWLIRTWGRWTGTLILPQAKNTAAARVRLNRAVASIASDSAEATRLGAILKMSIGTDVDIDALSNAVAKASMDPDMRAEMNKTELGEEFRKAGNSLAKYLDGQKEMPSGPGERTYIRSVFSQILSELQQKPEYADLTMADLQAVLWYAEKRLYETAKEDIAADEDTEGYADDEAPDYANAAAAVARTNGVSDRKIQNAMKKEESNGRAGDARPADGGTGGQGPEGGSTESRGFTKTQKRFFVGAVAIRRARSNRNGDEKSPWSYAGTGRGVGRKPGLVKKLGVTWVSEWRPGKSLGNVLRNNGFSTPTFYELTQGDDKNASRFVDAITASKASSTDGAAVYVYPVEEYRDMRLFLSKEGTSGVAVKSNGDIVSVFSAKKTGAGRAVMELAIAAGGNRLDAFDTILPEFYSAHGFRAVSRVAWDESQAPEGWSKAAFAAFNNGEPDVVFMVLDPNYWGDYSAADGRRSGYSHAASTQSKAAEAIARLNPKAVLNIRLDRLDGGRPFTVKKVAGELAKFGVRLDVSETHDVKGDPHLLVAHISRPLTADESKALGVALKQEAIAQYANGKGEILGPNPEKWGAFNPEQFRTIDGNPMSGADQQGVTYNQSVYHGSPHIFDRFTLDRIGTGEGAQAYGWGLYFASNKAVAKYYRDALSDLTVAHKGTPIENGAAPALMAVRGQLLSDAGYSPSEAIKVVVANFEEMLRSSPNAAHRQTVGQWLANAKALNADDFKVTRGRLYTANIPDDGAYLNWDKPLSEQSAEVQAALEKLGISSGLRAYDEALLAALEGDGSAAATQRPPDPVGKKIYRTLSRDKGGDQAASLALKEAGIPGIQYLDGSSRGKGEGNSNYVIFDEALIDIQAYEQSRSAGGPRGSISFDSTGALVRTFAGRDPSTVLHELWHYFHNNLEFMALAPDASPEVKAMYQATLDYAGVKGRNLSLTQQEWARYRALSDKIEKSGKKSLDGGETAEWTVLQGRIEQNEVVARAGEAFLMTGKSPSEALANAFRAFKNWLITVYRSIKKLNVPVSAEFDAVMAQMIATKEEIEAAQNRQGLNPVLGEAKDMLTAAERDAYTKRAEQVLAEADDKVRAKIMAPLRKATKAMVDNVRSRIRGEVTEEVMKDPGNAALYLLRNGKLFGSDDDAKRLPIKLSLPALIALVGEDGLKALPAGIHAADGMDPTTVAQMVGLGNAQELVERLMQVQTDQKAYQDQGGKGNAVDDQIHRETHRRVLEEIGDPLNDGSLEKEVDEAIHSDKQGALMAFELKVLARKAGHSGVISLEDINNWADSAIAEMSQYQAVQFAKYQRAERSAGIKVQQALLKGDIVAAFKAKQDQLVNFALYKAAKKAAEDSDKITGYLDKMASARTIKALDQDYLDTIHEILEEYDFKRRSGTLLAERTRFNAYKAEQLERGVEVKEPPRLKGAERKHFSQMSMEELREFYDTIKQIDRLGRKKKELFLDGKKRELEATLAEMEATAAAGVQRGTSLSTRGLSDLEKAVGKPKHLLRVMNAALLKIERLLEFADGDKTGRGIFTRMIFRPIADAQAATNDRRVELGKKQKVIYEKVPLAQRNAWKELHVLPELGGIKLDKEGIIAIALNMGNASNLEKLLLGEKWTEDGVRAVVNKYLTKEEWTFVQDIWDLIDSQWPEAAAMIRDVEGVEPPKIEAVPLQTPFGTLKGGYYPVEYARGEGLKGDKVGEMQDSALMVGMAPSPRYGRPSSKAGSTNARTEFNAPFNLSLSVIGKHLDEITHDIFHRRAVADIYKIISNDRFRETMRSRLGEEYEKVFMPWLKRVANEARRNNVDVMGWDWAMKTLRVNVTMMAMGLRVSTMVQQVAGYANSMQRLGPKDMLAGMAEFWPNPGRAAEQVYALSGEMRHRANNLERDVKANLDKFRGKSTWKANVGRFAFRGIALADLAVSIPTWLGAYRKALADGFDEADAVAYADKMVRDTQGAGGSKDLSAFQDGGETWKIMGMFYSFLNVFYNAQQGIVEDARKPGKSFSDYADLAWQGSLLMIVSPLMAALLSGQGPDDEEDPLYWAMRQVGFGAFAGIPIVRDLMGTLSREMGGKPSAGFKMSPVAGPLEGSIRLVKDLQNLATGEEVSKNAIKNFANVAGGFSGLPTGQIGVTTQFLWDSLISGSENPENLLEWMRGLTFGPEKK